MLFPQPAVFFPLISCPSCFTCPLNTNSCPVYITYLLILFPHLSILFRVSLFLNIKKRMFKGHHVPSVRCLGQLPLFLMPTKIS